MKIPRRLYYAAALLAALTLAACGDERAAPNEATALSEQTESRAQAAANPADSTRINWFQGTVKEAFASAKRQNKPLFLYWGAAWCPPCHELKATVFTRPDFIAASQDHVALHIDGDDPGAQQHAEQFAVVGYPTMVVFDPQGVEQTRIPNGLDVQVYADVLQNALNQMRPVSQLITLATTDGGQLTAQQCQTLENYSWGQDPGEHTPAEMASTFAAAAQKCDSNPLYLMHLISAQRANMTLPEQQRQLGISRVGDLIGTGASMANDALVKRHFYLMLSAGEPLSELLAVPPAARNENLLQSFAELYSALARDSSNSIILRMQALRAHISLLVDTKAEGLPVALGKDVDALLAASRNLSRDEPEFHATINTAANLLREAGYLERAKELLSSEIEQSKYAYYFMGELAYIEDLLGNRQQAMVWLRKAFDQSRGPATRFQWGVSYLTGLLELDPDNQPKIDTGFEEVFAEVANSRAFYQRSRIRLQRLDQALRKWAGSDAQRLSALQRYRNRTSDVCNTIPAADSAHNHCTQFLGGV